MSTNNSTFLASSSDSPGINIREKGAELLPYGEAVAEEGDGGSAIFGFISTLLTAVGMVAGLLLFFNLIYAGIQWLTSGGDSGKLEKARNRITHSIIGIVIFAGSVAIVILLQELLGVELLKFSFSGNDNARENPTHYYCCPESECSGTYYGYGFSNCKPGEVACSRCY